MDASNPKSAIVEKIKSSSNILVTVSRDPSVDSLTSALGLTLMLNKISKHTTAVFSGAVPPAITFLDPEKTFTNTVDSLQDFIIALDKEKADRLRYKVEDDVVRIFITPYRSEITEKDLQFSRGDFNVDLIIALGVDNQDELDSALAAHGKVLHSATIISIGTENKSSLGSIDWVDNKSSSLCEMLMSLSEALQANLLDEQIATALLTGIVAATNRFSNRHTTPRVMTMAAQLMAAGANQQLIASKLEDGDILSLPKPSEPQQEAPLADSGQSSASTDLNITHDSATILSAPLTDNDTVGLADQLADRAEVDRAARQQAVPDAEGGLSSREEIASSAQVSQAVASDGTTDWRDASRPSTTPDPEKALEDALAAAQSHGHRLNGDVPSDLSGSPDSFKTGAEPQAIDPFAYQVTGEDKGLLSADRDLLHGKTIVPISELSIPDNLPVDVPADMVSSSASPSTTVAPSTTDQAKTTLSSAQPDPTPSNMPTPATQPPTPAISSIEDARAAIDKLLQNTPSVGGLNSVSLPPVDASSNPVSVNASLPPLPPLPDFSTLPPLTTPVAVAPITPHPGVSDAAQAIRDHVNLNVPPAERGNGFGNPGSPPAVTPASAQFKIPGAP
ncbi:MAG: hypothetical protein WBB39_05250 [Candidatus Saccharimonadales bacterium]